MEDICGIELFAGAGGLALGLEKSGIKNEALVEIDHTACTTLRTNRPNWNVTERDIHNVDFTHFKNKIAVVSGGCPCQAFSYAGKKLGFEDERGTLFAEFVRCVSEVSPKMFLFENVVGLLSHDKGRTFDVILKALGGIGYDVQYKVLDASYFGVGQKRKRLIIIGSRHGLNINFNYPQPELKQTTLRQALKNVPKSEGMEYSENKRKVMELVPAGGCWTSLPKDVAEKYMGKSLHSNGGSRGVARRLAWDEPCLTLTASPSQKITERCHPDETRPLTIREYARIQSFPDDWVFSGNISQQYRQIGNAVPVELARRVGLAIMEALKQAKNKG